MSAEKIERFWKNATADDVVRVMKGEAVEARFRDSETQLWGDCYTLIGWVNERRHQWRSAEGGGRWNHCQVYREPSWWLERPDPGRGWRLLGKFPDEPKLATDEAWDCHLKEWRRTFTNDGNQVKTVWYRRRVEEVEPKFAVGQTVRVIGPKIKPAWHWGRKMDRYIGLVGVIRNSPLEDGSRRLYNLEGIGIWCFREDYLEAVEPEPVKLGEGSRCPIQGCSGSLRFRPVKDCACHIRPPCSYCEDNLPHCEYCEWTIGDPIEEVEPGPKHCVLPVGYTATLPSGQTITITEKGFEVKK